MADRWWLRPGDKIWYGRGKQRDWRAWFLWDDLKTTWGLAVNAPGEDAREPNAWWHYDSQSLQLDREVPEQVRIELASCLRDRSPPPALTAAQRRVLDTIAAETVTTVANTMTGRKLRQEMGPAASEAMRTVVTLVPRFLRLAHGTQEEGDDVYAATLVGLLESRMAPEVSGALEHALLTLKQMYARDANLLLFTWKDLADEQWSAHRVLFEVVIDAAALSDWHSENQWRVPKDIEQVQGLDDVSAFLAWLPEGRKDRAWRSAPCRLPMDTAVSAESNPAPAISVESSDRTRRVFYSWQSDLPGKTTRNLIEAALKRAASAIAKDDSVDIDPVVDRDTAGLSGSPDIKTAILDKIDRASVFVADVSIIGEVGSDTTGTSRAVPNPNVLIELGYAIRKHGWDRIIMVINETHGSVDRLPFDLRGHRTVRYTARPDQADLPDVRKVLASTFEQALRAIFEKPGDDSA